MADELPPKYDASGPNDPFAPADGRVLGITVLMFAFFGGLVFCGLSFAFPEPMSFFFVIWSASAFSLTAVWLGLGNDPLALRLGVLGIPGVLLMLIPMIGGFFACLAVIFLILALPLFALRLLGFEFKARADSERSTGSPVARAQFSLKQLLIWSAVASLLAFLARFVDFEPAGPGTWRGLEGICVAATALSLITLGTVCTTLIPIRNWLVAGLMLPLVALSMLIGWIVPAVISALGGYWGPGPSTRLFDIAAGVVGHVALVSLVLLSFRRIGYRLWRRGARARFSATN